MVLGRELAEAPYEIDFGGYVFRNCTGHYVTVVDHCGDTVFRLAPAPIPPIRVNTVRTKINSILYRSEAREVMDLPRKVPGVYLIVSSLVKINCQDRDDLVVPSMVAKVHGRPVGCRGFIV